MRIGVFDHDPQPIPTGSCSRRARDPQTQRSGLVRRLVVVLIPLLLGMAGGAPVLAAGPVYWDYPDQFPFEGLELSGVALDGFGRLVPGLQATELLGGGPEVFWRAVSDGDGGIFVGSGHAGEIWRIPASGEPHVHATVPQPEIFSLLRVGEDLYVGCGPDGHLYRIDRHGELELRTQIADSYIWALAADQRGRLFLATGAPASVYQLAPDQDPVRLRELPALNALALAVTAGGELLVGTQGPGLIYRMHPERPAAGRLLHETAQDEVRQLLTGAEGQWYALAVAPAEAAPGPNGNHNQPPVTPDNGLAFLNLGEPAKPEIRSALYRLGGDDVVVPFWESSRDLLVAAYCPPWGWLGGGKPDAERGQAVLQTLNEPGSSRPIATWEGGDLVDLLVLPTDEGLVACLANPGQVVRLENTPATLGSAVASPLDGGLPIHWGRLTWRGHSGGSKLRWSVRGGDRSTPDDTWSEWSDSWSDEDHTIELPPSRYLQWRVEFAGGSREGTVAAVTVSGYEDNRRPRILDLVVQDHGTVVMGGLLARSENVTENFRSGLRAEYNLASQTDRRADLTRTATVRPLRALTWRADDPNGDRLVYQLEYQRVGEQSWRPIGEERRDVIGSWDTATVPDGMYLVRLRASDRLDNPAAEALDTHRSSLPFQVDNTPPEISRLKLKHADSGIHVTFRAEDDLSYLGGAQIELPDGTSERLDPEDRICDSRRETFAASVVFPRPDGMPVARPWRLRVLVVDRHGNVAVEEGELP